jgi:dihydroxynaphthoic acid synthetase
MPTGQTRVLRFAFSGESTHMEYEDITYEHHEGIATITINRPTVRNALRPRTYEELTHAMHRAADEPEIGVVVLTGAGNHAFCAGGDVRDQAARTPANGRKHMRRLFALSSVMRMMDKPIIAKVRGFCVGGGNELNLFCDLTVASSDAKFGQVGPRVGSVPIWGACQLLARYVGERKAREMLYTCRLYSAQEAMDMGLINQVCAAEELDSTVTTLCSDILQKSPQSIRIAKLALNAGSDSDFYPSFFPNAELLASAYGNEENREGIVAFLEKRSPDFGRFRRR